MTTEPATRSLLSDLAVHPGEALAEELAARQVSEESLAAAIGEASALVGAVCRGESVISARFAVALERGLPGLSARYWLNLQRDYDLTLAYRAVEQPPDPR